MKKKKKNNIDKTKKNLVLCPHCGFENPKHLKECLSCSGELIGAKSCPRCAKINLRNAKKCVNCGYRFNKSKISTPHIPRSNILAHPSIKLPIK